MRQDYPSMKPFNARCRWWRPEGPSNAVPGIVGFDGTDIVAQMDDWVGPEHSSDFPRSDVLHGEMSHGVKVTIYDAFVNRVEPHAVVHLLVNTMAVGEHLGPRSEQKFSEAVARVNGLGEWWRTRPIKSEYAEDGSATIHCAAPSSIDLSVPERSVSILLREGRRKDLRGLRSVNVVYEPGLLFVPHEPETIDWIREIVDETRQLLSLFTNQDAAVVALDARPKLGRDVRDPVEWFWNRLEGQVGDMRVSRVLMQYDSVEKQLEHALRNWLSKAEALRHARGLLFSTQARPAPFLETRFLPIIQALEVYCRALGSEKYIPESEFEGLKERLLRVVPSDLNDGLQHKLRTSIGFANELSLYDRILQLLNSLEDETRRFVCQDAERFARRLRDSRNYYTHYGSRGRELTGKALHWATGQASLLLKILMLKECGFPEALIQNRLRVSGHHVQGMEIWAEIEKEL